MNLSVVVLVTAFFTGWLLFNVVGQVNDNVDNNWFYTFIPAWIYEGIFLFLFTCRLILYLWRPRNQPLPTINELVWEFATLGALIGSSIMAVVNFEENSSTIPWPVVAIPFYLYSLATGALLAYESYRFWQLSTAAAEEAKSIGGDAEEIVILDELLLRTPRRRLVFLWMLWVSFSLFVLLLSLQLQHAPHFPIAVAISPLFIALLAFALLWWYAWRRGDEENAIPTLYLIIIALTLVTLLIGVIMACIQLWIVVIWMGFVLAAAWVFIAVIQFMITRSTHTFLHDFLTYLDDGNREEFQTEIGLVATVGGTNEEL